MWEGSELGWGTWHDRYSENPPPPRIYFKMCVAVIRVINLRRQWRIHHVAWSREIKDIYKFDTKTSLTARPLGGRRQRRGDNIHAYRICEQLSQDTPDISCKQITEGWTCNTNAESSDLCMRPLYRKLLGRQKLKWGDNIKMERIVWIFPRHMVPRFQSGKWRQHTPLKHRQYRPQSQGVAAPKQN
jgi:hypothetical protein